MHAQEKDTRIATATFFTTQTDFTHAGDLKVFVDEAQIASIENAMVKNGYLDGSKMATAFNMLRASDLIWPYVVNNYLKGKGPMPFDLLYWNSDATRMPAANHSFYLRNCYLENNLSQGKMKLAGKTLKLSKVKTPIYNLAAREDHIAPARSAYVGGKLFGGDVTYVMSGSGHIAGVINPPEAGKYQFWSDGPEDAEFDDWVKGAKETPGSWWPHWHEWIRSHSSDEVPAREPRGRQAQCNRGCARLLCPHPGLTQGTKRRASLRPVARPATGASDEIFDPPLIEATLVRRYKRFSVRCGASVRRAGHRLLSQHRIHARADRRRDRAAISRSMLRQRASTAMRLSSWKPRARLSGSNTARPNHLVEEAMRAGLLGSLGD